MKGRRILAGLGSIAAAYVDCFLPQFCMLCGTRIPAGKKLCSDCSSRLKPEPVFFCPLCRFEGKSVDLTHDGGRGCGVESHNFVAGRAGARAGAVLLSLVHMFKYSGEREIAPLLAGLIFDSNIVNEDFRSFDLMCPVPLFRTRFRERGFNQSAEIARCLEIYSGVPLIENLLSKTRATAEQAKLAGNSRRRNLVGSFVESRTGLTRGKRVVLVDDVVTTASTVAACIEALAAAGAVRVLVVAVAA